MTRVCVCGGVSFKKLLLSNLGRSQEDSPWARQPLLPSPDLCYSCKDNSVKENADGREGVIQRLRPSEPGCLSIKQDWGLGREALKSHPHRVLLRGGDYEVEFPALSTSKN